MYCVQISHLNSRHANCPCILFINVSFQKRFIVMKKSLYIEAFVSILITLGSTCIAREAAELQHHEPHYFVTIHRATPSK